MLHFGFITIESFHMLGILVPDYVGNVSMECICLNIGGLNIGKWVTLIILPKDPCVIICRSMLYRNILLRESIVTEEYEFGTWHDATGHRYIHRDDHWRHKSPQLCVVLYDVYVSGMMSQYSDTCPNCNSLYDNLQPNADMYLFISGRQISI